MLIAVISDTHRVNKYINAAKNYIKDADVLIHLGDNVEDVDEIAKEFKGQLYVVKGNCYYSNKYPLEQVIEIMGKRIFITHGHLYSVKNNLNNIYYRARELEADIVLFGHTHTFMLEETLGMTFMNPGSISLPRLGKRYVGYIRLEEDEEPDIYVKELKE